MKAHVHKVTVVFEIPVPESILYTKGYVRDILNDVVRGELEYAVKEIDDQNLKVVMEYGP